MRVLDPTDGTGNQQDPVSKLENYHFFLKSDKVFNERRKPDNFTELNANENYSGAPTGYLDSSKNQGSNSYEESEEFYNYYEDDLDYRPAA